MRHRFCSSLFLAAAFAFPAAPSCSGQASGNLAGVWSFDLARKQVYVDSVNAGRSGAPMSEIAAAMGLARLEGSQYEFGAGAEGPFLSITDKTSRLPTIVHVTVGKSSTELILTARETGHRYRLRPIDPRHLDLVDEQKRVTIPLTRR